MLLRRLADTSAAVAATSSRTEKRDLLAAVLADLADEEIEAAVGFLTGSIRQGAIGVGWATVSKVAVETADDPTLEVLELDGLLTEIAATTGSGSAAARARLLATFLARATPAEHEFVRRVLIGDLRQGALARRGHRRGGEGGRGEAGAAPAGRHAAGRSRSRPPVDRPHRPGPTPCPRSTSWSGDRSSPCWRRPRPTSHEAIESFGRGPGRVEARWGPDPGSPWTAPTVDDLHPQPERRDRPAGPQVGGAVPDPSVATSAVLDGEVLGFFGDDPGGDEDLRPQPFQDTMSAFGTDRRRPDRQRAEASSAVDRLRAYFFDLMYLDGVEPDRSATDRAERRARPPSSVRRPVSPGLDHRRRPTEAAAHARRGRDRTPVTKGVMVKSVDGVYEAGRRGKSWRKVKPVHTLDLVVLAAEWGHGRRRGWLSNLHLGSPRPGRRRLHHGRQDVQGPDRRTARQWQTERFLELKTHESGNDGHVVHLAPELVVEIALDGAQTSHPVPGRGGAAVRPRPGLPPRP